MPNFRYKAYDQKGHPINGRMQADNTAGVSHFLSGQGFVPVSIKEASPGFSFPTIFKKVTLEEIMIFTRQLWTLYKVGIPLQAGLESLRDQTKNESFKMTITEIIGEIESGRLLSEALASHPGVFDSLYIHMVKAGETSGKLDEVLFYLAEMCQFESETKDKINAATRYPLLTLATLGLAFLMVVTFVIPKFTSLFRQFKATLPLPTRVLLAINDILRHQWFFVLLVLAALFFLIRFILGTKKGRYGWDALKIKFPVTGLLLFNLVMSRFAKILAQLLSSGTPIVEALELVSKTVGNAVVEKEVLNIQHSLEEGKDMSEPMKKSRFFTPLVVQMITVGEQTGKMPELLNHVASYYESQANTMIKNLTTLIEPMLILILGGLVLLLALGIFLPTWDLTYVVR